MTTNLHPLTRRTALGGALSLLVGGGAVGGCSVVASVGGSSADHLTVASDSMAPTVVEGQVITVDPVTPGSYRPQRQDIVVLHPTPQYQGMQTSSLIVRRVIGIPGDSVYCNGEGFPVVVDGVALKEPYLYKGDVASTITFHVKVPAGCLWLLGDHRSVALDCRYHLSDPDGGAIPLANITGIYHPSA